MGMLIAYVLGILTATKPAPTSQKCDHLPNGPFSVISIPPAPTEEEKAQQKKRRRRKTILYRVQIGSLAVLFIYAVVTTLIWRANTRVAEDTHQSVVNADRNFRIDERAWMAFKFMEGNLTLTLDKSFLVPTELVNVGKTPAKNVHGNIVVGVFKKGEPLDFTYTQGHANYGVQAGTIFPTGKIDESFEAIRHGPKNAEPIIFTALLKDELFNAKSFIVVHGKITYNDVFGKEHWTTYCRYVFHPDLISEECTRYNDTDNNN
jgi:hypothetical protein